MMAEPPSADFANLKVIAFESRKAKEIATLISNQRGIPLIAPAMREIPLEENPAAFAFADELFAGRVDAAIFMTGVGARTLFQVLETRYSPAKIASALAGVVVVARGPKPIAVLREFRIPVSVAVPEPNTWREVLETLDQHPGGFTFEGTRIAVQEYGIANVGLLDGLRKRGAELIQVPVYRWGPPSDLAPLREAVQAIVDGEAQVVLFTNAFQVESVLTVAAAEGCEQRLRDAFDHCVVCSVGPTCSEALAAHNVRVDIEPQHPKMGMLVYEAAQRAPTLLRDRRSAAAVQEQ
jgi:uroporphyrinogen-III synthase